MTEDLRERGTFVLIGHPVGHSLSPVIHAAAYEALGVTRCSYVAVDCPDAAASMPKRNVSTTALQALNLFNSQFMVQQAGYFAARLKRESGDDVAAQVRSAFSLAFGREPDADEAAAAAALAKDRGLEALCRALFNASELIYVN